MPKNFLSFLSFCGICVMFGSIFTDNSIVFVVGFLIMLVAAGLWILFHGITFR